MGVPRLVSADSDSGKLPAVVLSDLEARFGASASSAKGLVYSKAKTDGTDQASLVQAELDALVTAGGGTWVAPIGTVRLLSDITIKNDNATPPVQPPIVLQGLGEHWSGRGRPIPAGGASVLDLRGSGSYGHIVTSGLGALAISRLTLTDTSGGSTPFVYTTNTALKITETSFIGSKTGVNCNQDAIILGGPNQVEGGGGLDDGFQGYGTEISGNYFQGIRRGLYARAFANGIYFEHNYNSTNCGNPTGAFVEIDGKPTTGVQTIAGGVVGSNIIEVPNYAYGIWVKNAVAMSFTSNDFFDGVAGQGTIGIKFETTATDNRVIGGFCDNRVTHVVDLLGRNSVDEIMLSGVSSVQTKPLRFTSPVGFGGNGGAGPYALSNEGAAAYAKAGAGPSTSTDDSRLYLATRPAKAVTDAVLTSGSTTVTSASAAFVASDQGLPILATGIPGGTFITQVLNGTTVTLTKAATASSTSTALQFGRLGTETQHIMLERGHLVGLGTAPVATGTAATGNSPTLTVTGTDLAGTISIIPGASPTAGTLANITTNKALTGTGHVALTPANAAAAALFAGGVWAARSSSAVWMIGCTGTPVAATEYRFSYHLIQAA